MRKTALKKVNPLEAAEAAGKDPKHCSRGARRRDSRRLASSQLRGGRGSRPFTSPSPAPGGPDRPRASAPRGPLLPALRVAQANLPDRPWRCGPCSQHNLGAAGGGGCAHLQNNRGPESTLVLAPGAAFPIAVVRTELQDDKLVNTAVKSHLHKNDFGKRSLPRALTRDSEPGGLAGGRGTAAAGRPRSLRSPLSRSGGHGGGSPARRPPRRAGTSRCRSRWAERTHTHTQTGRARASGDRAGRAGGAQLPPPLPPLLLLVPPLVLMLRAPRQKGQPRDVQQRPRRVHNLLSTAKLPLATSLFSGFHLQFQLKATEIMHEGLCCNSSNSVGAHLLHFPKICASQEVIHVIYESFLMYGL
ncbi:uncharacterized protein LOC128097084 [Peromyscus californicus insignis]|uniref:uncharacterized protein LOC128097084 n=1 Tax=Peromyscus californicus insignis TaxID=564181 RepID=UPI0022A73F63|nr:uncharacterized protein LOC128097084 [Peromyscus californicus insignis]